MVGPAVEPVVGPVGPVGGPCVLPFLPQGYDHCVPLVGNLSLVTGSQVFPKTNILPEY